MACVVYGARAGGHLPSPIPGRRMEAPSLALFLHTALPFPSCPAPLREACPVMDLPMLEQHESSEGSDRDLLQQQQEGLCTERYLERNCQKLLQTAHVWQASPCQGPTQPWEPVGLWRLALQGIAVTRRVLLSQTETAVTPVRLFLYSFYLSVPRRHLSHFLLAGDVQSIPPKVLTVFTYHGLASGSDCQGDYGQCHCFSTGALQLPALL